MCDISYHFQGDGRGYADWNELRENNGITEGAGCAGCATGVK
jgi:hypothetical protein